MDTPIGQSATNDPGPSPSPQIHIAKSQIGNVPSAGAEPAVSEQAPFLDHLSTASEQTPAALPLECESSPSPAKPNKPLSIDVGIGQLDLRTPAEEIEFQECEAIIHEGWGPFTRVGEALARIRDKQLYKNEYASFDLYCRERWGFGRTQAGRYITAAEVQKGLATAPGMPVPKCEAQIRPMVGLSSELAQQAWLNALSWSRENYVPARLVKRAVRQVLRAEHPAVPAESNAHRMQRSRLRQSVRAGFQELLALLLGNAQRDVLIAKVQEIQRLLDSVLAPKKTKTHILTRN